MTRDEGERSIPLARHMLLAIVVPVILLVTLGGVLTWQLGKMSDAAQAVIRTNGMLAKLNELRMLAVQQESSLRRYLLTGDRTALLMLERDSPLDAIPPIRGLTDDPQQLERLHTIDAELTIWYQLALQATKGDHLVARDDTPALQRRTSHINHARDVMSEAVAHQRTELGRLTDASAAAERTATRAFLGLLVLSALAIALLSRKQLAAVSNAFQKVVDGERAARAAVADREWIRHGEAATSSAVIGERTLAQVAEGALAAMAGHTGAVVGAIYQVRGDRLRRLALHGGAATDLPAEVSTSEGVLGQVVRDRAPRSIRDAETQLSISGGVGKARTVELVMVPATLGGETVAVVELGFDRAVDERTSQMMGGVATTLAIAVRGAEQRARLQELLEETQRQGEELQTQHEELRVTNEELEHQGQALREANARQQNIQHELEAANANLEEQTAALEQQREELLRTQKELQERARELQLASQYKSEFLARMSHELRTPLNSSLILARLLADNPTGNLTEEQVRFATTIHGAGNDLLLLINDILDLAKIEAGRLELRVGSVPLARVRDTIAREFEPVARSRGLGFRIELAPGLPERFESDEQRLIQVLRNLVSNACKFTDRGEVSVTIRPAGERIEIAVHDTGIGIPRDQLDRVFEAFHQVDGSVSRKHGGTGLGLAISRDLAHLLGGELLLASEPGHGSTFTLTIPRTAPATRDLTATRLDPTPRPTPPPPARRRPPTAAPVAAEPPRPATDDRERLEPGRRTLLVIEDDEAFAGILRDLARELDFQVLHAPTADEGVALALRHHPDGILCDVQLPDHSGLSVLERIKRQPATRHIPIHMLSVEDHTQRSLELGAIGYLLKPTSRDNLVAAIRRIEDKTSKRVRHLLIVEDDATQAAALGRLLGAEGVEISASSSIAGAMAQLRSRTYDCMVMDLRLEDGTGFELLERMTADDTVTFPPVIVHTGKALSDEEEARLRKFSTSIIVKGARSPERLLDEVTLFLHQVESELPPERQKMLREVRNREAAFDGKRVLIVEDDVRNVFALSSVLEPRGIKPVIARNGREALEVLGREPVDLVLMDVMMPEMNGIEATQAIRREPRFANLPVIALTAKAMADDRQACLDAGANDYLAKPFNVDMLLSLLRVWMPR